MDTRELVGMALPAAAAVALTYILAQARGAGRLLQPLREGRHVRQLDTPRPNIEALTAASAEPNDAWLPATMPAQVHDVLLAHGKIPDPHVGRNAPQSAWVGKKDWAYGTAFASPPGSGPVFLRFGGLDTLLTAYVNSRKVGHFENMYRRFAVEVREHLRPAGQRNVPPIVFSSRGPTRSSIRNRETTARAA